MKQLEISCKVVVYDSLDELNSAEIELIERSKDAINKAYAPYSNFHVGCAIQMGSGEIVSGGNQENASYPACICAEGVTLAAASSTYPQKEIAAVAIHVNRDFEAPVTPCGVCRQRLWEKEHRHGKAIKVYLSSLNEKVFRFDSVKELLPMGFSVDHLNVR